MDLMQIEKQTYLGIVKDKLYKLGDSVVTDDINILADYVVTRFLKTSPIVVSGTDQDVIKYELDKFVTDIYSMLVTFIYVVNSLPVNNGDDIQ